MVNEVLKQCLTLALAAAHWNQWLINRKIVSQICWWNYLNSWNDESWIHDEADQPNETVHDSAVVETHLWQHLPLKWQRTLCSVVQWIYSKWYLNIPRKSKCWRRRKSMQFFKFWLLPLTVISLMQEFRIKFCWTKLNYLTGNGEFRFINMETFYLFSMSRRSSPSKVEW